MNQPSHHHNNNHIADDICKTALALYFHIFLYKGYAGLPLDLREFPSTYFFFCHAGRFNHKPYGDTETTHV